MKTLKTILVIVLIISGLLPMPVIISALFNQDNMVAMLKLDSLSMGVQKLLLINGAFMLSFIVLFWVAAAWVANSNKAGYTLALILGIITLLRGILMMATFGAHQLPAPFLANIAMIDGTIVLILSLIANRKVKTESSSI